jgi:hypothetical protein
MEKREDKSVFCRQYDELVDGVVTFCLTRKRETARVLLVFVFIWTNSIT